MINGAKLARLRSSLGISRQDLADKLGMDYNTIYSWEGAQEKPLKAWVSYAVQGLFPEQVIVRDNEMFVRI